MARSRKTVDVATLVDKANRMIASNLDESDRGFRYGVICLTDYLLMAVNAYHGFAYLDRDNMDNTLIRYYVKG